MEQSTDNKTIRMLFGKAVEHDWDNIDPEKLALFKLLEFSKQDIVMGRFYTDDEIMEQLEF
ncbi:hypothetical protein FHQ28_07130 [Pasteurellaceae bacterium USgator11]|nr:hypothetical protein FHQ20_10925 [Pasteurellaceae bacterium USgator41]TNG91749.1 hypothetical protein FHQ19_12455 [Pasteurellaceae bacterium UScroc12]TNG95284.1 hypothetical protein FHQ24_12690 [Pasteurellaceae bacterium UScroc31]TNH00825.1 hypothetical protein FHQ28_07130 [Pasteurellaceae bacterium USgator11]